jgi:hypothetical protein
MTEAETETGVNSGSILRSRRISLRATVDGLRSELLAEEINKGMYKKTFTRVYQVELKTKHLVDTFNSYPLAQKATGICSSGICNAIHRKKQPAMAGGFVWFNNRQAFDDFQSAG